MKTRERKRRGVDKLLSRFADGFAVTVIVVIVFAGAAILVYRSSPSIMPGRREFTGKIVDKRISVHEWQEGSSFTNELVIEEKTGRRFVFRVTDEMYGRAKVGMWIRRSKNGIDLMAQLEQDAASP